MAKSSSKKIEKAAEELSYEEALAELEQIVSALESDQSQLEDAIQLFERGQALAARCGVLLEAAELKVKQVVGDDVVPFEEESNESRYALSKQASDRRLHRLGFSRRSSRFRLIFSHTQMELGVILHQRRHAQFTLSLDDRHLFPWAMFMDSIIQPLRSVWRSP